MTLETLNRRNTETVESKLKEQDKMIRDLSIRIDLLQTTLSSMNERMNYLDTNTNLQKVRMTGTGPSVV